MYDASIVHTVFDVPAGTAGPATSFTAGNAPNVMSAGNPTIPR